MKKPLNLLALSLIFGVSSLYAQESINTSGGDASGEGGSVSYSIGQVFYTTASSEAGSVHQGIQQVYQIDGETGIEGTQDIKILISAYPNPVVDLLTLEVKNYSLENLGMRLFSTAGKPVSAKRITSELTEIDMSSQEPGVYVIKLYDNSKEIKSFTITKSF